MERYIIAPLIDTALETAAKSLLRYSDNRIRILFMRYSFDKVKYVVGDRQRSCAFFLVNITKLQACDLADTQRHPCCKQNRQLYRIALENIKYRFKIGKFLFLSD